MRIWVGILCLAAAAVAAGQPAAAFAQEGAAAATPPNLADRAYRTLKIFEKRAGATWLESGGRATRSWSVIIPDAEIETRYLDFDRGEEIVSILRRNDATGTVDSYLASKGILSGRFWVNDKGQLAYAQPNAQYVVLSEGPDEIITETKILIAGAWTAPSLSKLTRVSGAEVEALRGDYGALTERKRAEAAEAARQAAEASAQASQQSYAAEEQSSEPMGAVFLREMQGMAADAQAQGAQARRETNRLISGGGMAAASASSAPPAPAMAPMPAPVNRAPVRRTLYGWCWAVEGGRATHMSAVGSRELSIEEQEPWRSQMTAEFRQQIGNAATAIQCDIDDDGDFSYTRGEYAKDNPAHLQWAPH